MVSVNSVYRNRKASIRSRIGSMSAATAIVNWRPLRSTPMALNSNCCQSGPARRLVSVRSGAVAPTSMLKLPREDERIVLTPSAVI